MAELLRRALDGRRRPLDEDVTLRVRFARGDPARGDGSTTSSPPSWPGPAPYKAGRLALRARLVSEARRVFRSSARLGRRRGLVRGRADVASDEFAALLDTLWPTVSPAALVRDLLSSRDQLERYADGLFSTDGMAAAAADPGRHVSSTAWSVDDLALLDEATFLTGGRARSLRAHRRRRGTGPHARCSSA